MSNIVGFDTEHERDEGMASEMLRCLVDAYPGHGWFIVIRGGIVQVKDLEISDKWAMALHYSQVANDAMTRKRQILRSAGEWLERANQRRGRKESRITHLEGIPDKDLVRARLQ